MSEKQKRNLNPGELRRVGVPDVFIETAHYYSNKSAFADEPSPELIQKTISLCLDELRRKSEPDLAEIPEVLIDGSVYAHARESVLKIKRLGKLPEVYAESVWFAAANPEPPMMIVENHERIAPSWWKEGELLGVSDAYGTINEFARTLHHPVCSRVVVLKEDPSQYRVDDLEQLALLLGQATSDVYWISAQHGGAFANVDELVVGDQCVLRMTAMPSSPSEAVNLLLDSKVEDSAWALTERVRIRDLMSHSIPVKIGGHICPEFRRLSKGAKGMREAIRIVTGEGFPGSASPPHGPGVKGLDLPKL